jgi:archaellum component FlaD/FlaE
MYALFRWLLFLSHKSGIGTTVKSFDCFSTYGNISNLSPYLLIKYFENLLLIQLINVDKCPDKG